MFVDSVNLTLIAGSGGNGTVAWRKETFVPKGGPSGGNGGNGGSITVVADINCLSLEEYRSRRIVKASNGMPGAHQGMQGSSGKNLTITVPVGTILWNEKHEKLHDFTVDGEKVIVCKGGKGGKGNMMFKSPTNQAPNICTEGTDGEKLEAFFELKLLADIGFVGFPNAGKSTLMKRITLVPVKIAPYPFTTLRPNLSYVQFDDYSRVLIADIPGIVKNAHQNKGLGLEFLRHIERTEALLFLIDIAGCDYRDPIEDFKTLRHEITCYNKELQDKPFAVGLNKMDAEGAAENVARFRETFPELKSENIFELSAETGVGVAPLLERLRELAQACGKKF